jgi:phosphoribosylformylglycinamidine (FGAM) synthase-like amidotransferase family enzyme
VRLAVVVGLADPIPTGLDPAGEIVRVTPGEAPALAPRALAGIVVATFVGPGDPVGLAVAASAAAGVPLLALGAGARAALALGLIPGGLEDPPSDLPASGPPRAEGRYVRLEGRPTPFTAALPAGRMLEVRAQGRPPRYLAPDAAALARNGQVVFRHSDEAGLGGAIAGVCDAAGAAVALFADPTAGALAQLAAALRLFIRRPRSGTPTPRA